MNRLLSIISIHLPQNHTRNFSLDMLSKPYLFSSKPIRNAFQPPIHRKILLDLPPSSTYADPLDCNFTGYARSRYLILTRHSEYRKISSLLPCYLITTRHSIPFLLETHISRYHTSYLSAFIDQRPACQK